MQNDPNDDLSERMLRFAVRIGKAVSELPETRLGRNVAGQLVRSGTSPAPNYEEACAAENRKDFNHKMSICVKELRETRFWLRFLVMSELLPDSRMTDLIDESEQLCKIFGSPIATSKSTRKQE